MSSGGPTSNETRLIARGIDGEVQASFLLSQVPESELDDIACPVCDSHRRRLLFVEREFPVHRCQACTHMYVSPQPSQAVLDAYYAASYLPRTEDETVWEGTRGSPYDAAARAIAERTPARGDLLDVGSGFGGFLARAGQDGWRLHGVDPSESAFRSCRRRFGKQMELHQGAFEHAQLQPESFDCITMLNVIEHVRQPKRLCEQAFVLLRPGGCLALRWPQRVLRGTLSAAPAHLHGFTGRSITRMLELVGYVRTREYWAGMQDYSRARLPQRLAASVLGWAGKLTIACTFGHAQIPFVTRLTLAHKPAS